MATPAKALAGKRPRAGREAVRVRSRKGQGRWAAEAAAAFVLRALEIYRRLFPVLLEELGKGTGVRWGVGKRQEELSRAEDFKCPTQVYWEGGCGQEIEIRGVQRGRMRLDQTRA